MLQLRQDRDTAAVERSWAEAGLTSATAEFERAKSAAEQAAAKVLKEEAALPPGTFGSDLHGLGALSRVPKARSADDTLTVASGYRGSYPNFLFDVALDEIEEFTRGLRAVRNAADLDKLTARWGVRRSSPHLWSVFDWLHDDFRRRDATEFGLFDLNRYKNL